MYRRGVTSPPQEEDNATPRTIEDIVRNIRGRRLGFQRAFSTDVETFHSSCNRKDVNLCLFAYPNETWEVKEPIQLLPSELPEPVLGINISRDRLTRIEWLRYVAVHSDSWLLYLARFFGSRITRDQRKVVFDMINDGPTLYEQVIDESVPSTVEDIFANFSGRRLGFQRALFSDLETLRDACDPEKESLCLYAYPSGTWKVSPRFVEVPPELPKPVLGINYARDGLPRKDWIELVAMHSDSWLLSVAFFYGSGLSRNERNRLFNLINVEPTLYEQVTNPRQRSTQQVTNPRRRSTRRR